MGHVSGRVGLHPDSRVKCLDGRVGHDGMNLWVILFGIWYYAIVHQCKIICVCVLAVPVDKTTSMATAIIPFLILRPYGVRPAATPQV
jgi:hypothetical protein